MQLVHLVTKQNCPSQHSAESYLTLSLQCLHRVVSSGPKRDLQDIHISCTLANFIMPPTARLGVDIVMLRV